LKSDDFFESSYLNLLSLFKKIKINLKLFIGMIIILIPIILILSSAVFLIVLLLTSYFEFISLLSKNIHLIFKSVIAFFSFTLIFKFLVYKNIKDIYSDIDKSKMVSKDDLDNSNKFYLACINMKEFISLNDKNINSDSKPFFKTFKKIVKAITSFPMC
jgi:hypothetical protein